jgi:RNA polymerase sigma factor (sigma-70 family)
VPTLPPAQEQAAAATSKAKKARVGRKEAEQRVSDFLDRERHNRPTIKQVAEATGVSQGGVCNTQAWKEYVKGRGPDPPRRRRGARYLVGWIFRAYESLGLLKRPYEWTSGMTAEQAAEAYTLQVVEDAGATEAFNSRPEADRAELFRTALEHLEDACAQEHCWYYPRREGRSYPLDSLPGRDAEERAEQIRNKEWVWAGIDKLPEPHRTVLLLSDIEELDSVEVASRLCITREEVQPLLHQAREALRDLLASTSGEQGGEDSPSSPVSPTDHPAILFAESALLV